MNMEINNKFKEIDFKIRMCYYFDDIMRVIDIYFNNILLDEKSYKKKFENILVYDITYKTFMGKKSLPIRFDKIDEFIKIYVGIRYLVLLEYNEIFDKIKYLISEKRDISDNTDRNFESIRIDSCNSLPIEKNIDFS